MKLYTKVYFFPGHSVEIIGRNIIHVTVSSQTLNIRSLHIMFRCKNVQFSHKHYWASGPELIPVYRQSAHRWLFESSPAVGCHYFTPGLRSPSQLKNVTVLRSEPSYTDRDVNNLPKLVTQLCPGGNWTHDLLIACPCHTATLLRHLVEK